VHHLGPRYAGAFQTANLTQFLTYESATGLKMHLASLAAANRAMSPVTAGGTSVVATGALVKALEAGLNVPEHAIVFAVNPATIRPFDDDADLRADDEAPWAAVAPPKAERGSWRREGDVVAARAYCLDLAVWRLGGAAVPLRLVQLARGAHELSRALGILAESVRTSWQNAEDAERLRAYDVLAGMLRTKAALINVTAFEILFELLGMNFRNPECVWPPTAMKLECADAGAQAEHHHEPAGVPRARARF
jgi:hypothetical protein